MKCYRKYAILFASMVFKFFPDPNPHPSEADYDSETGDAGRELKKLAKKDRQLYLTVKTFLNKVKQTNDLTPFLQAEQIYRFPGDKNELYEMRIPKQRRGGVFRIYFCKSMEDNEKNTLILLCAELKHKPEPMKLDNATELLKKYKETIYKEERKNEKR